MKSIIFPKSLRKNSKIAIISPAGSVEKEQLQNTINLIETNGYQPIFGKYVFGKYDFGYQYSGTEIERIHDLNWALSNPEIDAIWATRGGYGAQHLLRHLQLSHYRNNPKWYIGYSDNTVIQSFLLKNNYASIHGQTIKTSSFGVTENSYHLIFEILKGNFPTYVLETHPYNTKGKAEGIMVGGNLALIYALLGSRYSFNFQDKILFIEDIGENFYALDRMLISLDLAGVFRKIKGLIVGGMTNMGSETENKNYTESFDDFAYRLVCKRTEKYKFPIVFEFPNGHIHDNRPLIIGSTIRMEVGEKTCISPRKT